VSTPARLGWLTRIAAGLALCAMLSVLVYLAVPPHAAQFAAARTQCAPLPHDAYAACTAPTTRDLVAWMGRGVLAGIALVVALAALHPWWVRRRGGLVALDDGAAPSLRAELAELAGAGREPTWLLAPYAYTARGRAFGLPWRPCVRIDVGLGILFRSDPLRFRAVVGRELDRLRDRGAGARYLAAGCLIAVVAAAPAARPVSHPASPIDACLLGYWIEAPRPQVMLRRDGTVTWTRHRGGIWSFTTAGVATLYLGRATVRSLEFSGTGTIRWRVATRPGEMDLTEPAVTATPTAPDPGDFVLPSTYTCRGDTATMSTDLYNAVLRRVGAVRR
jgi:hypothetical protein